MESGLEQQVLERLEILEKELAHYRKTTDFHLSEMIAEQKTRELVAEVDSRALQILFRQVTQDQLAIIFYRMPKETMAKVKGSLSKTVWNELLESWANGFGSSRSGACSAQNELLKIVRQLEEMGEIVWVRNDRNYLQPFSGTSAPFDLEAYRKEARLQRERELAEARLWIREELAELV